jgi:hypothetical protein
VVPISDRAFGREEGGPAAPACCRADGARVGARREEGGLRARGLRRPAFPEVDPEGVEPAEERRAVPDEAADRREPAGPGIRADLSGRRDARRRRRATGLSNEGLGRIVAGLVPGGRLVSVEPLSPDEGSGVTGKAEGYGKPLRLRVLDGAGRERILVFRTAAANEFGHDRRADRCEEMLLAFDTFGEVPRHVPALDVGAILPGGELLSLRQAGEMYLVTGWAEGRLYADDLRRIAREGQASPLDLDRSRALAAYLAELHVRKLDDRVAWRRAIRDLVGHGEGIAGICDAYPDATPGADPERLRAIERRCLEWRFRLRGRTERLSRTHGDFHPFNIVFGNGVEFTLLDASRGARGEPADDLAALAVNYVFFSAERPASWARGLGPLWAGFFDTYLDRSGDRGVLETLAPFLAWRLLVVSCPRFYPGLPAAARSALLGLAERALEAPRFDPGLAAGAFP